MKVNFNLALQIYPCDNFTLNALSTLYTRTSIRHAMGNTGKQF